MLSFGLAAHYTDNKMVHKFLDGNLCDDWLVNSFALFSQLMEVTTDLSVLERESEGSIVRIICKFFDEFTHAEQGVAQTSAFGEIGVVVQHISEYSVVVSKHPREYKWLVAL